MGIIEKDLTQIPASYRSDTVRVKDFCENKSGKLTFIENGFVIFEKNDGDKFIKTLDIQQDQSFGLVECKDDRSMIVYSNDGTNKIKLFNMIEKSEKIIYYKKNGFFTDYRVGIKKIISMHGVYFILTYDLDEKNKNLNLVITFGNEGNDVEDCQISDIKDFDIDKNSSTINKIHYDRANFRYVLQLITFDYENLKIIDSVIHEKPIDQDLFTPMLNTYSRYYLSAMNGSAIYPELNVLEISQPNCGFRNNSNEIDVKNQSLRMKLNFREFERDSVNADTTFINVDSSESIIGSDKENSLFIFDSAKDDGKPIYWGEGGRTHPDYIISKDRNGSFNIFCKLFERTNEEYVRPMMSLLRYNNGKFDEINIVYKHSEYTEDNYIADTYPFSTEGMRNDDFSVKFSANGDSVFGFGTKQFWIDNDNQPTFLIDEKNRRYYFTPSGFNNKPSDIGHCNIQDMTYDNGFMFFIIRSSTHRRSFIVANNERFNYNDWSWVGSSTSTADSISSILTVNDVCVHRIINRQSNNHTIELFQFKDNIWNLGSPFMTGYQGSLIPQEVSYFPISYSKATNCILYFSGYRFNTPTMFERHYIRYIDLNEEITRDSFKDIQTDLNRFDYNGDVVLTFNEKIDETGRQNNNVAYVLNDTYVTNSVVIGNTNVDRIPGRYNITQRQDIVDVSIALDSKEISLFEDKSEYELQSQMICLNNQSFIVSLVTPNRILIKSKNNKIVSNQFTSFINHCFISLDEDIYGEVKFKIEEKSVDTYNLFILKDDMIVSSYRLDTGTIPSILPDGSIAQSNLSISFSKIEESTFIGDINHNLITKALSSTGINVNKNAIVGDNVLTDFGSNREDWLETPVVNASKKWNFDNKELDLIKNYDKVFEYVTGLFGDTTSTMSNFKVLGMSKRGNILILRKTPDGDPRFTIWFENKLDQDKYKVNYIDHDCPNDSFFTNQYPEDFSIPTFPTDYQRNFDFITMIDEFDDAIVLISEPRSVVSRRKSRNIYWINIKQKFNTFIQLSTNTARNGDHPIDLIDFITDRIHNAVVIDCNNHYSNEPYDPSNMLDFPPDWYEKYFEFTKTSLVFYFPFDREILRTQDATDEAWDKNNGTKGGLFRLYTNGTVSLNFHSGIEDKILCGERSDDLDPMIFLFESERLDPKYQIPVDIDIEDYEDPKSVTVISTDSGSVGGVFALDSDNDPMNPKLLTFDCVPDDETGWKMGEITMVSPKYFDHHFIKNIVLDPSDVVNNGATISFDYHENVDINDILEQRIWVRHESRDVPTFSLSQPDGVWVNGYNFYGTYAGVSENIDVDPSRPDYISDLTADQETIGKPFNGNTVDISEWYNKPCTSNFLDSNDYLNRVYMDPYIGGVTNSYGYKLEYRIFIQFKVKSNNEVGYEIITSMMRFDHLQTSDVIYGSSGIDIVSAPIKRWEEPNNLIECVKNINMYYDERDFLMVNMEFENVDISKIAYQQILVKNQRTNVNNNQLRFRGEGYVGDYGIRVPGGNLFNNDYPDTFYDLYPANTTLFNINELVSSGYYSPRDSGNPENATITENHIFRFTLLIVMKQDNISDPIQMYIHEFDTHLVGRRPGTFHSLQFQPGKIEVEKDITGIVVPNETVSDIFIGYEDNENSFTNNTDDRNSSDYTIASIYGEKVKYEVTNTDNVKEEKSINLIRVILSRKDRFIDRIANKNMNQRGYDVANWNIQRKQGVEGSDPSLIEYEPNTIVSGYLKDTLIHRTGEPIIVPNLQRNISGGDFGYYEEDLYKLLVFKHNLSYKSHSFINQLIRKDKKSDLEFKPISLIFVKKDSSGNNIPIKLSYDDVDIRLNDAITRMLKGDTNFNVQDYIDSLPVNYEIVSE
jgi:hypothetical protein